MHSYARQLRAGFLLGAAICGQCTEPCAAADDLAKADTAQTFAGSKAGEERAVASIKLCWCPAGRFVMGSPRNEPERRPGENQVDVILSRGFWMAKYETTQGQWKRVMGRLPGELTAQLPEGE